MTDKIPCPKCKADLVDHGEVSCLEILPGARVSEREPVLDLILECVECKTQWNAFVPLQSFLLNEVTA